jgi:subtilisin family serine protease
MSIHRLCRALPLALAFLSGSAAVAQAEVVPDQVVVRFAPDATRAEQSAALSAAGAQATRALPLPDTQVVQLTAGSDEHDAAADLQARDDVLWAEPNYVVHAETTTPNDPSFASLWGLSNTGQTALQALLGLGWQSQAGVAGIDIGATAAWDTTTGSASVDVGVVDTGIAGHRDLDANVDTGLSRDFRDHGAFAVDDPRADADGHGTHVAGTIGAIGDNATDVTGVAWHTGLVALRVLDAGSGTSADVAAAFDYAGDQGIRIVNASLGGPDNSAAIATAIRDHPGTLYVVAAGNDGLDVDGPGNASYPCAYGYANLVCVASIDNDGDRSYYSNYGSTSVDLGAPGNGVLSTYPAYTTALSATGAWSHAGTGDSWSFSSATWTSNVAPSVASTVTSPDADLTGLRGCSVRLTLVSTVPASSGAIAVERSVDGGTTWEQIGSAPTPTAARSLAYPADADGRATVRMRVRLTTTAGAPTASAAVKVSGWTLRCLTPGTSSDTASLSGTSMATPMVAGVAALLLSSKPGATVPELRTALLSSVTPTPALAGATVTGGRVDAEAALTALATGVAPGGGGGGASGGGGGGGGGGGATKPPVTEPTPITVPTPVTAATPAPAAPAATPPAATLRLAGNTLLDRGRLTLRVGVSARATLRASATLRWRGGSTRLRAVTAPGVAGGQTATLQLRATARGQRAIRRARQAGRRIAVHVVVTVTGADGASRQVRRTITLR